MTENMKMHIGIGVPDEQVTPLVYTMLLHIPNSEERLLQEANAVVGFLVGLLASTFRDFDTENPVMRLAHLTVTIEVNSSRRIIYDNNVAVPSTEAELAQWLDEIRKKVMNKTTYSIITATLPLVGNKRP